MIQPRLRRVLHGTCYNLLPLGRALLVHLCFLSSPLAGAASLGCTVSEACSCNISTSARMDRLLILVLLMRPWRDCWYWSYCC
jgi:hypothetical protein